MLFIGPLHILSSEELKYVQNFFYLNITSIFPG